MKIYCLCFLILMSLSLLSKSDEEKKKHLNQIALKLWSSVPQSYSMPEIKIINDSKQFVQAYYDFEKIKFGSNMYDLCSSFGEDAIAVVLAHELAHYFYKHQNFGSDENPIYSFALNKTDSLFMDSTKLQKREALEMQADIFAAMKCFTAGYNVDKTMPLIFRTIYQNNKLKSKLAEYIDLTKRVQIAEQALDIFHKLLPFYNAARYALLIGQYEIAGDLFTLIAKNKYTASDVYLNAGIAYTRAALEYAPDNIKKYYYPLLMELNSNITSLKSLASSRGDDNNYNKQKFENLLEKAENRFNKILNKDNPEFSHYLNFGCQQLIAGNIDEAHSNTMIAIKNAKSNKEKSYSYILNGLISAVKNDTSQAIDFINQANILDSSDLAKLNICLINNARCGKLYTTIHEKSSEGKIESIAQFKHNELLTANYNWKLTSDSTIQNDFDAKIYEYENDSIQGLKYVSEVASFVIIENRSKDNISARGVKIGDNIQKIKELYGIPKVIMNDTKGQTWAFQDLKIAFRIDEKENVTSWLIFISERK